MTTVEELSEFPRLAGLPGSALSVLAAAGQDIVLAPGLALITEGQVADRCWLIHSGRILLTAYVVGRGDVRVQTLGRGELLGWSWRVPPYRWRFSARVVQPTAATEFSAAALNQLTAVDPEFDRALSAMLFEALLERLQATRARLLDLYRNPVDAGSGAS
ncbi:Crp/Fnr family transcriptional regulator [Nocardia jiangxiensis]|uniref:Crp/Fnr family transcriptional regulator n=1 Tax=Nocardia jiangxiensis TaxID=282685 RepID=A0ABW6SB63_9NOCA|nr:cyclic nucleotide-binding domain-containing protein [Nocardia jiangxiensis]